MLKSRSKMIAIKAILGLLSLVVLFHILVLLQVVPYEIVWAGKLQSKNEMYVFETVSILINMGLIALLLLKGNYIKHRAERLVNGFLWFFIVVFLVNTIGNLFAKTDFERFVFTPLTLILAILIWIVVRPQRMNTP